MSLAHCPECGHEVSVNAAACPNCGLPIAPPVAVTPDRKVVVVPRKEGGIPPWAIAAIGGTALLLIIILFLALRNSDETANTNLNVNVAQRRANSASSSTLANSEPLPPARTTDVPGSTTSGVTLPPDSTTSSTTTTVPGTTTSAPVAPPPDKGTVVINAKISPRSGQPQPARSTKFYLLDKDVETILSEARVEPIEGNSLAASLGLAIVFPDRFGDFQRRAMRAIASHAKFSGTTGAQGSASLSNIAPEQYYLFAITKIGRGFAMWNSPVSITTGENVLNLSPQSVTEIPDDNSGE